MLLSRDLWTEAPALPGVESEQAVSLIKAGETTSADPAVGRFYVPVRRRAPCAAELIALDCAHEACGGVVGGAVG